MRVLVAPTEIAGQMSATARGLRQRGHRAVSCNHYLRSNRYGYPCDRELALDRIAGRNGRRLKRTTFFLSSLLKYDVFHLHFGNSLLRSHMDLPILSALGKTTVMEFWGSDVRRSLPGRRDSGPVLAQRDGEGIRENLTAIGKHVRTALVADLELKSYVEEFFEEVCLVPQRIVLDGRASRFPEPRTGRPLVVHAPSNRGLKGTEALLAAVDALRRRINFEFLLVENMPNEQACALYERADIIVDQLRIGTYGLFAVESMAAGKPVISHIREEYRDGYPPELPIVSAGVDSIREVLEDLLKDGQRRHELGVRGREYVERRHSAPVVADLLVDVYERAGAKGSSR